MDSIASPANQANSILLCHAGFESTVLAELEQRLPQESACCAFPDSTQSQPGLVRLTSAGLASIDSRRPIPLIFERQRLENAQWIPDGPVKPTARQIVRMGFASILRGDTPWTLHSFIPTPEDAAGLTRRADNLAEAVLNYVRDHFPKALKRYRPPDTAPAGRPIQTRSFPYSRYV